MYVPHVVLAPDVNRISHRDENDDLWCIAVKISKKGTHRKKYILRYF